MIFFEIVIHTFISVVFVVFYVCKFSKLSKCLNFSKLSIALFVCLIISSGLLLVYCVLACFFNST